MKRSRLIIVLAALCLLGAATAEQKPAGSPAPAAQPALAVQSRRHPDHRRH